MKEFEFTAYIENSGAWIAKGTLKANNIKEAENKIMNQDFEEDNIEWDTDDLVDSLSVYQYNGDRLHTCLEKIKSMDNIDKIHLLVEETLNNLIGVVTINDLIEIEND